jgi:hypothetical protein
LYSLTLNGNLLEPGFPAAALASICDTESQHSRGPTIFLTLTHLPLKCLRLMALIGVVTGRSLAKAVGVVGLRTDGIAGGTVGGIRPEKRSSTPESSRQQYRAAIEGHAGSPSEFAHYAIIHLEITGGMGMYRQDSAVDTLALHCAVTQDLSAIAKTHQLAEGPHPWLGVLIEPLS